MESHQLRPYQLEAENKIRELFRSGHRRVMLKLPTGAGKTVVFSSILKQLANSGNRGSMMTRGIKLIDQAHKRLLRENVNHGVIQAKHWLNNPLAPVQICSVDTLTARNINPPGSLLVIDEAHLFTSKKCVQICNDFISASPNNFILSVTATPYTPEPLTHLAETYIQTITMKELIEQGYLVPPIYYAPTAPNLSNVRTDYKTKDYVTADLESVLNGNDIVGNLVENWLKYAEQRSTLVFAVSIKHSKHIAELYNAAGIPAEHCDADTPEAERERIIERLINGTTKVVTNVGIFCTGVDIPSLGCIQMARPTKSYNLFIQQAGRGTRTAMGKNNFILLDNAGNTLRHGFITDEPEVNLNGYKKRSESAAPIKTCKKCFAVYALHSKECPQCGYVNPVADRSDSMVSEAEGELIRVEELPIEAKAYQRVQQLKRVKKDIRFNKKMWIYNVILHEFGEEIARKYA